jgi:hypothetical protein
MAPGQPYPYLAMLARIGVVLSLFLCLFFAVFWSPGVLLGLFAIAYAADSRMFSHALDPRVRHARNLRAAARYRGGRLDSPAHRL